MGYGEGGDEFGYWRTRLKSDHTLRKIIKRALWDGGWVTGSERALGLLESLIESSPLLKPEDSINGRRRGVDVGAAY